MPHRLSITLCENNNDAQPLASLLSVDRALSDLRRGQIIALNNGDEKITLVMAAEGMTKSAVQRLKSLSGLTPDLFMTAARAKTLGLAQFSDQIVRCEMGKALRPDLVEALINPLAELSKNDLFDVKFTSVDAKSPQGAGIGLCKLARLIPSAIMVDLHLDPNTSLEEWLKAQNLLCVLLSDVFQYEETAARSLKAVSEASVPLEDSPHTKIIAFRPSDGGIEHFAIVIGELNLNDPILIRIHSECFTGDLVASLRCDCGDQLRGAIQTISEQGSGILLYLAQEGRGIGLVNKLRAYKLQDSGIDTFDANEQLGYDADERVYLPAAQMLSLLGVKKVRLLTNNPEKVSVLQSCQVDVVERVEHAFPSNQHNEPYLKAKATKGGHYL